MSVQVLVKILAVGGVGYLGYRVYQSYQSGQSLNILPPIDLSSIGFGDDNSMTDTSDTSDTSTTSNPTPPTDTPSPIMPSTPIHLLAWGAKVSQTFRERVAWIGQQLGVDPSWVMDIIAFESAGTFRANVRNPYSNFVGLIQFGPAAAAAVGSSLGALAAMTAEDQLNYVYKYFQPYTGRIKSLSDLYMVVLWPAAVGQSDSYVLFASPSTAYTQNKGLDSNGDGKVTKAEAASGVRLKSVTGMLPGNVWVG